MFFEKEQDNLQEQMSDEILLVEDNIIIQNMLQKTFALTPYKTVPARNGKEALRLIKEKKQPFKAVLLDLLMPVLDGVETIKKIRKLNNEKAKITVIAVTGNDEEFSSKKFKELGFNAAVIKPVDCNKIVRILEVLSDPDADRWLGVFTEDSERGIL